MAYGKLWKVCQDYGLGIQSVNLAISNLDYFKAGWTIEHGSEQPLTVAGAPLSLQNPYSGFGAHNTPPIPRAVVRVKPTSTAGVPTIVTFEDIGGVVRATRKINTGTWLFDLDDHYQLFFADPRPAQSNNTVTRFCEPYGARTAGLGNGIVVKTYELSSGDFVLTDYEFTCPIYSYV